MYKKGSCAVLLLCVIISPLFGQIIIDWTEVPQAIGVEFTHNGVDSVDVTLGPGGGSAGVRGSWS